MQLGSSEPIDAFPEAGRRGPRPSQAGERVGPSPPARILVVDDHEVNRQLLGQMLAHEGYEVLEAGGGKEALALLEREAVDLVLLDVMMPQMDGFEVCRIVREERGRLDLPIVFITAHGDQRARRRGKEVGGDDFLPRPVDRLELLARVRSLVKTKAWHDARAQERARLARDLDEARAQLVRLERLATLGTLAAGVGHELGNLATVHASTVLFLEEDLAAGKDVSEHLEVLRGIGEHLKSHARHLLDAGRPGHASPRRVDLRDVATQVAAMLEISGRAKACEVRLELPEVPMAVMGQPVQLEQVLVNLATNASDAVREARRDDGWVVIRLREAGDEVVLEVEDNGCGIPEAHRESIRETYFTTKPPEQGTGLGIPVASRILEAHGGRLEYESEEGRGTVARAVLPRLSD